MVADAIGYSREAYSMLERGIADPHEQAREALMQFFRVTDPADLDLGPSIAPAASLEITIHQLEPYSRHELISALQQLPALADVDVSILETPHVVAPEAFFQKLLTVLNACWHLLEQRDGRIVECLPVQELALPF